MTLAGINPRLFQAAQDALNGHDPIKRGFVPGEGAAAQGAGGAAPDPGMGGGGMPPGGGAPPPDAGGGMPPGGGGSPMEGAGPQPDMQMMIHQAVQQAMMMNQGGGGGGMGKNPMTPKIDEKAAILQILKILALIADALGVRIPASEMVVSTGDMTQFANNQQSQQMQAGAGGAAPAGGAGMPNLSPPQPMGAMPGAAPGAGPTKVGGYLERQGDAFDASGLLPPARRDPVQESEALAILLAGRRAA